MLLSLFFALSFSVRENEKRVCVCWDACPKVCDVFEKILVYNTPDLDAEFKKVKTKYMDVRFCHAPNGFSFNIGTFDDVQVQFDSFHLSPKSHIKVMVTRASTAEPSFHNLDVTFIGYSTSQTLDLKSIIMKDVDSRVQNLAPRLYTQSFEADNSVYDFVNVTIKKNCSDPALSIDILKGYQLGLTIGKNVVTLGSSTFYFEGKATATISTELADAKLTVTGTATEDMPYLILIGFPYTTFKGIYPENYIIQMQNLQENTVIAEEERLPISLDGARVNVYITQLTTTIEGDSSCDLGLYVKQVPAFRKTVRVVKLNGNLDVYDSHLDVVLDIFNPGLQLYGAPWTFCVGSGNVSTLLIKETLYSGLSSVSFFKYHCDFDVYPDEDLIRDLISEPHRILLVNTNKTVFTTDSVSIMPADDLQIPGFSSSSNCISIQLVKSYPFEIQLTAISPTKLPMKLCYADLVSECNPSSDGFFINDYTISKLSECIYPGFTDVAITLKKDLPMIRFDTLSHTENIDFKIKSASSNVYSLGIIKGATTTYLKSLTFTRVNLGGVYNDETIAPQTTFIECGYDSVTNKTFDFDSTTQVTADDSFVENIYPRVTQITNLNLNIKQTKSISVQQTNVIFNTDNQIKYSDLNKFQLNVEGELHLNIDNPAKEITINHAFKPSINPNRLYITGYQSEKTVTYNHDAYDVEIIRNRIEEFKNLEFIGTGEISYQNDFEESSRICVSTDDSLCKGDYDLIVNKNDNGASIQNEKKSKVYVDVYNDYKILMSNLDSKYVIVQTKKDTPTLTLDLSKQISKPILTTTEIHGFTIQFTNPKDTNNFGHIEFADCIVPSIDFGFAAVNYIGPYSSIANATSITINGYIDLYGEFTKPTASINFGENNNTPRRFRGVIPDQSTVTALDSKININNWDINVGTGTNGYDVDLYTNSKTTFTLTCESEMSTFPSIKFSKLESTTVNFEGSWPELTTSESIKLLFEHTLMDFTLNVKTKNVPATFAGVQMNFHINCEVDPVFYGMFNVISEKYYSMTLAGQKTIRFEGGIGVDHKSWIKIMNPINIFVSHVTLTNPANNAGYISFQNYVSCDSNSKVTISNPLENIIFNPTFEVYGDFKDSLDSDKIVNFLKKEVNLLSINSKDVSNFQTNVKNVAFVDPKPITHGFIGDNFGVTVSNEGEVNFKNTQSPTNTPVEACYMTKTECEYSFDESNITQFASVIPSNIQAIEFIVGQSNTNLLSFDDSKISHASLKISSSTKTPVALKVNFGNDRIDTLIAENIDFEMSGSINKATFINSVANSVSGIKELNYDLASYSRKPITEYSGKLLITYTGNKLVYTANGWSFETFTIESSKIPQFSIECTTNSIFTLDISDNAANIIVCPIVLHTTHIELGKNWDKLKSLSDLNITLTQPPSSVLVTCQSNPFAALQLLNGTTIQFSKDTLPIHVKDRLELEKVNLKVDLSLITNNEKLYIENGISLSSNSTIEIANSKSSEFSCSTNELVCEDESDSSAYNIQVTDRLKLYGNAKLSASLNLTSAKIEFHWWKSHMPYLQSQIETAPSSVSIHFDGKSSESDYLKDKSYPLVDLGLNCEQWLDNVEFKSKVKQFNGKGAKSKLTCESGVLTLSGSKGISTLSPGVIAAIVISCIIGVALIALGVFFFIKKKKQTTQSNALLTKSLTNE